MPKRKIEALLDEAYENLQIAPEKKDALIEKLYVFSQSCDEDVDEEVLWMADTLLKTGEYN